MPFALAWEAFKAFGIWRKLAGVFGTAWRWITASTTHILIVALIAVAAWGWLGWHGKAKADKSYRSAVIALDGCQNAAVANAKAQADQKARVEAEYKAKAEKADDQYHDALADAGDAADRYIAAHRVRTGPAHISATPASPEDHRAEVPSIATADAVAVSEADVKVCAVDYEYAAAAYAWASSLESKP